MKFSEMQYERPDIEASIEALKAATEQLRAAKSYEELRRIYLAEMKYESLEEGMAEIADIRHTGNTADPFYNAESDYLDEARPKEMPAVQAWMRALCESPFRADFEREYGRQLVRRGEAMLRLVSEETVSDRIEENRISQEYMKTVATCQADFMGESCNFYGLLRHMQSPDRAERRAAMELWAKLYEGVAPALDTQYDRLVAVRRRMAEKLGFSDYIEMAYLTRNRFDYDRRDVARFRDEIRRVVTPACTELYRRQQKRLGIDRLCYYDEALVFPGGNPTPHGTVQEMVGNASKLYHALSPQTGEFFDFMTGQELFDLETRPNKHMGGYCTYIDHMSAPFIFSNFNGTSADVDVLTHEAGHAFEAYIASRKLPLSDMVWSTSEINEIHSMSMEQFAYPWMELFFGDRADDYRYLHLAETIKTLPYLCMVDEFQERVFDENPDAAGRRRIWKELEAAYMPWRDYDGCKFLDEGGFWMQKQHIFLYPFYYVDYALAQLCAFDLYRESKTDRAAAFARYLKLCESGGSRGYLETLAYAGFESPFAEGAVARAIAPVLETLEAYEN